MPHVIYKGIHYPIRSTETILDGLIAGGADVRYSCRRGSCHTCILQSDPALVSQFAKNHLPATLKSAGMFLPCVTYCTVPLELRPPDWSSCFVEGVVAKKDQLPGGIVRLLIDTPPQLHWAAGQHVYLRSPSGAARPYSIASVRALDYYMELHVQRYESGQVSSWVGDTLRVYDTVHFRGPLGESHYRVIYRQAPLVLLATGVGVGAALAVAREAKLNGHEGSVKLFNGVRDEVRFYVTEQLRALALSWASFSFSYCCSGNTSRSDIAAARVSDAALETDLQGCALLMFGNPAMVNDVRTLLQERDLGPTWIHADAFTPHSEVR